MKRILFFLALVFFVACAEDRGVRPDPQSYEAKVAGLVESIERQAERLGVPFGVDEIEEMRNTFLSSSSDEARTRMYEKMCLTMTERHRCLENVVEIVAGYMEKALRWRRTPPIKLLFQVESFKVEMRKMLTEVGVRVPSNGDLIACLQRCGDAYESCYQGCPILDDLCWYNCGVDLSICAAGCPGIASSGTLR